VTVIYDDSGYDEAFMAADEAFFEDRPRRQSYIRERFPTEELPGPYIRVTKLPHARVRQSVELTYDDDWYDLRGKWHMSPQLKATGIAGLFLDAMPAFDPALAKGVQLEDVIRELARLMPEHVTRKAKIVRH
jgi:hypothetical protein